MAVQVITKSQQATGQFNGGEILENKPLGFPQEGGLTRPYSNLFYWAHAWSEVGSTIGLHPHNGFEIMSFVLKGELEHYDTKVQEWIPLKEGSAQIIRSGSGISHSEKINAGCHIFQIWLDPDLRSAMAKPASYDDYSAESFPITELSGVKIKWYKGGQGPMTMDSYEVVIKELIFPKGKCSLDLDVSKYHSWYLIEGSLAINWQEMETDDFAIITEFESVEVETEEESRVFAIENPLELPYATYAQLRGMT